MVDDRQSLSSPEALDTVQIELADGQCWSFPAPMAVGSRLSKLDENTRRTLETRFGMEYLALIHGIVEAENESERCRADLALAIHLFCLHHAMTSQPLRELFTFPPESPELEASRQDFRDLSNLHLREFVELKTLQETQARPFFLGAVLKRVWPSLATFLCSTRLVDRSGS